MGKDQKQYRENLTQFQEPERNIIKIKRGIGER